MFRVARFDGGESVPKGASTAVTSLSSPRGLDVDTLAAEAAGSSKEGASSRRPGEKASSSQRGEGERRRKERKKGKQSGSRSSPKEEEEEEEDVEVERRDGGPKSLEETKSTLTAAAAAAAAGAAHDDAHTGKQLLTSPNAKKRKRAGASTLPSGGKEAPLTTTSQVEVVDAAPDEQKDIHQAAREWSLSPLLLERLKETKVTHFFPIQLRVIPDILAAEREHHATGRRDICVSAPTGSGKTLVFVIGIIQALLGRCIPRVRALILLPTKELAIQVHSVFATFCHGTPLRAGLAVGQRSLAEEQSAICGQNSFAGDPVSEARVHGRGYYNWKDMKLGGNTPGGHSAVDILVATPGRLLDHLDHTPGLTLQHLRFIVVDEADRLLSQDYHSLIERINQAVYFHEPGRVEVEPLRLGELPEKMLRAPKSMKIQICTARQHLRRLTGSGVGGEIVSPLSWNLPFRKLLFSATLTNDPQQLARLGLVNPIFYLAKEVGRSDKALAQKNKREDHGEESGEIPQPPRQSTTRGDLEAMDYDDGDQDVSSLNFSVPSGLSEYVVRCKSRTKPLALVSLLRDERNRLVNDEQQGLSIVFCSSVDSSHRLCRLLQLMGDAGPSIELSASLSANKRAKLLSSIESGDTKIVVCSDSIARGMDLAGVGLVVNYDAPLRAKTYIHRVGRTARAGRQGCAVTLVKRGQEAQFAAVRRQIRGSAPQNLTLLIASDLQNKFQSCLDGLRDVLKAEEAGRLAMSEAIEPADCASSDDDDELDEGSTSIPEDAHPGNGV